MSPRIVDAQPITPEEVAAVRARELPNEVIEAFNSLIAQNFVSGQAKVMQREVIERLVQAGIDRNDIFDKHYLDVEHIYEAAGWKVVYDKPGRDDSYKPYFIFSVSS